MSYFGLYLKITFILPTVIDLIPILYKLLLLINNNFIDLPEESVKGKMYNIGMNIFCMELLYPQSSLFRTLGNFELISSLGVNHKLRNRDLFIPLSDAIVYKYN